jgi:hypothetical protein
MGIFPKYLEKQGFIQEIDLRSFYNQLISNIFFTPNPPRTGLGDDG